MNSEHSNNNHVTIFGEESERLNSQTSTDLDRVLAGWGIPTSAIPPRVRKWSYWLGSEVVLHWRVSEPQEWSISDIFQEVNPQLASHGSLLLRALEQTNNSTLSKEVEKKYKQLEATQKQQITDRDMHHHLVQSAVEFASWYSTDSSDSSLGCVGQLRINSHSLATQLYQKLELYFFMLRSGGSRTAVNCLEEKSAQIQALSQKYECLRQEWETERQAHWEAFLNLSAQLVQPQWLSLLSQSDRKSKAQSALTALKDSYQLQLEAQLCSTAANLLQELKQAIARQATASEATDLWLANLQSHLAQQQPLANISAAYLQEHLLPQIDCEELRHEIEMNHGSLYDWATSDLSNDIIVDEILTLVRPICWRFFAQYLLTDD